MKDINQESARLIKIANPLKLLVRPAGFEPATYGFVVPLSSWHHYIYCYSILFVFI